MITAAAELPFTEQTSPNTGLFGEGGQLLTAEVTS